MLLAALLVAVGAGMVHTAWTGTTDARDSEAWPTVSGSVIESYVDIDEKSDGADSYDPVVRYTYSVDDEDFEGSRVAFGQHDAGDRGGVERTVARYPVGEPVDVAYDPEDPGRSVLEPGEEGANTAIQFAGVAIAVVGIGLAIGPGLLARRRAERLN